MTTDPAATIAQFKALLRPIFADPELTAAINGLQLSAGPSASQTVTGGIPKFYRRPDEPIDKVPDRYRNWMTDAEWEAANRATLAQMDAGKRAVSVPGQGVV